MRKKPTQARAGATVEAILGAAAQVLQKDGEEGLTTAKIAARAGVSIGSIYQYFPNKDAILLALLRKEREAIAADIARALADIDPKSGEAVVSAVIASLVATARRRRKNRKRIATMVMLTADRNEGGVALRDRISDLIVAVTQRYPDLAPRPLTPTAAFVLTRAVLGAIRLAVVENAKILDDPTFEEELCRLARGYLRG